MSLTSCLAKAGTAINAEDRAAIIESAGALRRGGMDNDSAAIKAVEDRQAIVRGELDAATAAGVKPASGVQESAGVKPGAAPEAADAEKDSDGHQIRKVGDRVVIGDNGYGYSQGRHGVVTDVNVMRWQTVVLFGGAKETGPAIYTYTVKTDGGSNTQARGDQLQAEQGPAPVAVPDIKIGNDLKPPAEVLASIGYKRSSLRTAEGKLARAKVEKSKKQYREDIARFTKEMRDLQAAYDTWAAKHGEPAATTALPAASQARQNSDADTPLSPAGLTLTKTTHTKTGADLWVVKMADRVERAEYDRLASLVKRNGGIWSKFTKGFNFSTEDGARDFLKAAGGNSQNSPANAPALQGNVAAPAVTPTAASIIEAPALDREDLDATIAGFTPRAVLDAAKEAGVTAADLTTAIRAQALAQAPEAPLIDRVHAALAAQPQVLAWMSANNTDEKNAWVLLSAAKQLTTELAGDDYGAAQELFERWNAESISGPDLVREMRARTGIISPTIAPQEAPNDSTPSRDSPALNQPLDAGQPAGAVQGTQPVRGAQQPRDGAGRADDRGVRGPRGRADGLDDARQDLGNARGDGAVSDRPADPVERDGGGIPGRDYQPEVGGLKREGSWHGAAKRNLDLIDLALKIEGEKRAATPEEQALLSKYVGFGASAIRNEMFKVADDYLKKQNPKQLIFPQIVYEARWKALAERAAALPLEWQRSILQSTQYAHYTDEGIVRGVWSAMQRLGFTGGKVFEPGGGIGSFAMLMPGAVRSTSTFTGIEMDGPTALIARLLSPEQHMQQGDFIKRKLPANFYDAVVGNPPFAQTIILGDADYEKYGFMLHDYFFAKSMDKLRPGGVLAFVTSKGTMDKKTDKARRFLMERADLIGAIRLPSVAFEENAGTSVVTDVIFLRKRLPGEAPAGQAWNNVKQVDTKDGPVFINEYFAEHPEMVLGQNRISGNRDDQDRRINSNSMGGEKYTVVSYDETPEQLHAKFAQAVERLPANVYSAMQMDPKSLVREVAKMDFDPSIKREGVVYLGKNGDLLRVEEGTGKALSEVVKLSAKDTAWLKSYVGVRDLVQAARLAQVTDGDWKGALKKLNAGYDAFVKQHGPVNKFRVQMRKSTDEDGNEIKVESRVFLNRRLFREDYSAADVTSLETIDEDGNFKKSPFLLDRTIGKPVVRKVETIGDSLAVSLDSLGALDLDDVANRLKITRAEAIEALGKQVYQTPDKQWLLADEYLSGNVVDKLAEAIEAARLDPDLTRNVEALKEVQPEKLGPSKISVKLGAAWVQAQHVNDFSGEIGAGDVTFDSKTETWQVAGGRRGGERGSRSAAEWGTASRSPSELLEGILNSKAIKIMKAVASDSGKGTKDVLDPEATTAAQEMAKKIKDKFRTWVWTDSARAADLVEAFNERFNNIAGRLFDGSHLTLPGMSLRFTLHLHQLRAIWRQIQTGNTYLAHAVGAGKTIEMIVGAMEQKRLGLIKKPMFVVPNHMLEQFSNEFMELYPLANIMVADDQNFSKERRKAFIAAATMNAPDAIIITHDAFQRIGVKEASVAPIRDALLADLEDELAATAKDSGARVRRGQLEQQIEQVNQRFDSILASGKKDGIVDFEDMGVDMIYGDEAHVWRKLDFHTAQTIKGIDPNGSKRALDMYIKTQYLNSQRPGRAFVFASGTPVTNTMGEIYTIMRFFAPAELERSGITTFDSWARMFGEVAAALEPNAAGKYESVERFAKFDNVPELMSRVRAFMDVLQSDQLGAIVKRPDMKGGKPNLNLVQPTQAMKDYQEHVLNPRLVASRDWKPSKDQPNNPDPVINIITDGRFAAADPRFIPGAKLKEGEQSKLDLAADKIIENYKAIAGNTYNDQDGKPMAVKGGTQIVFYNVGFGDGAAENRGFSARDALTKRLTAGGIPRAEIAWFDDANTDAKKEAIFKGMRNGAYKVMVGSAKKMGTGVNVQNRLAVLHYMDPPWYPADVEQPHGRIIRQGNQNTEVALEWYATKGGYDSTMWQMVGRKQRFIDQAFSGDKNLRSMDDLGEASLFEQAAALSSGDPRAVMLAGLKQDVERFERLQAAHAREQLAARQSLEQNRWSDESSEKRVRTYEKALAALGGGYFRFTQGTVSGRTFEKHGELGEAIKDAFNKAAADEALKPGPDERVIAKIGALEVSMTPETAWTKDNKQRERTGTFELDVSVGGYSTAIAFNAAQLGADVSPVGLVQKVMNFANGIDSSLRAEKAALAERAIESNKLQKKIGAPFEYQGEMLDKWGELKQLEEELLAEGAAAAKEGGTTAPTQRVMLDADGRGWKILKGPYRQAKVLMVTAERMNDDGQTEKQELRYDSLKDVASLQEQASQAQLLNAPEDTGPEPDSLFSRGRGAGIALNDAKAVVAAIREANPSAPPIHLLDSVNKAPDKLLADIKKAGAQNDVEATYHDGEIYVFYKNIGSIERALFVVGKHEIRHHGLRSMLGDRLGPVLMRMGMQNPALRDAARAKMKAGHANDFVTGVEEALADMPVEALTKLTGWERIVAAFRAWARKVAERIQRMHPNLADLIAPENWTDADVALMVIRAEGVSRGGAAPFRASGTAFAKGEPQAVFSRAGATTTDSAPGQLAQAWTNVRAAKLPGDYIVNDFIQKHGQLSWWDKSVGSMHNLAERNPLFKPVYDAAQNFLNDVSSYATEAADLAPRLLPKLEGLRDIGKAPLSAADTKAISAPIFEGTLNWTRDASGKPAKEDDPQKAGIVWTDGELKSQFKLSTEQIALYREFRKATDKSLADLAISDMLRYAGHDADDVAQAAIASADVHKAADIIKEHLADLADAAGSDRAAMLATTREVISKKADHAGQMMLKGYAPLTRFGNYTLDVTEDGKRVYFGLFESQAEANQFGRKMRAAYPKAQIQQGTLSQKAYQMFAGVSPETVELFGQMLGLESQGNEASSVAFQEYLKLAKGNRSAMKRMIERGGIAGFSEDAGRVLAGFVYSNARQASKNLHFGQITAAVQKIADVKGQGQLLDTAVSLHQYITNPVEEAQKFKGLLFANFLGGSLAAGFVNLTQTVMVTFPYLTQFGGVGKAAMQMKSAVADALKWETGTKTTGDKVLDAAIKRAEDEGVISPQEVHALIAQAGGNGALKASDGTTWGKVTSATSNTLSKAMLLWGRPFAIAEQFNRRVTFIAAFRTAVEQGMDDPAAFAEKAVVDTQFSYTKANRPAWARGAIGSTLFTFKTYSISYVELLVRMGKSGPEGRKAALVGLGMLFMMSGLQGLPGSDDLDDLIDGALQRMGFNFSSKLAKREFFAKYLGETGSRFVMRGVSGLPGVPIDVAGRLGLGNLIPGTGLLTKKTDHTQDVAELFGPAGAFVTQAFKGVDQLTQGNIGQAAAAVLPVAAQNALKAADMASTGMYRDKAGRKVIDTDGIDAAMKFIGFQPNNVATVQQATRDVQQMIGLNKMRESEIADKWARGIFEQNNALRDEARDELARWNENNPSSRINIGLPQLLKRMKAMREDKITRLERTSPKEMRATVRQELAGVQ